MHVCKEGAGRIVAQQPGQSSREGGVRLVAPQNSTSAATSTTFTWKNVERAGRAASLSGPCRSVSRS